MEKVIDWEWYAQVWRPLLDKQVEKMVEKPLWYEVYIDLDETIERWYSYMRSYPNLAAYSIARWLVKRDSWYWSPSYVKALNKAIESKDAASAFNSVLENSLKKK